MEARDILTLRQHKAVAASHLKLYKQMCLNYWNLNLHRLQSWLISVHLVEISGDVWEEAR